MKSLYVRSPLNYMGGKYKLLPQILPKFPTKINTFVDLFAGGLDVSLNVTARETICLDVNNPVVELYNMLDIKQRSDTLAYVSRRIRSLGLSSTNNDGYIKLRALYNKNRNPLDLFVLIAFSFNHQARFNSNLEFNTPFGKDRSSFNPTMRGNLIRTIDTIHSGNFEFLASDFRNAPTDYLTGGDFLYADPPYLISSGTYNDGKRGYGGWAKQDDTDLFNLLDSLNARDVLWALSNVTEHKDLVNEELVEWARSYTVHNLSFDYSNSSYQAKSRGKKTQEVLITNYKPEGASIV